MKKTISITLVLLVFTLVLASCSTGGNDNTSAIDMSQGKASFCFDTLRDSPTALPLEAMQRGEIISFNFEGVYLEQLLKKWNITDFTKLEAVTEDMGKVDITEYGHDVFLAWSESGMDESPMRVMPSNAETANLLIRNVTSLIITR